jgi:zinc protease
MPSMFDYSREFFAHYYRPDNAILLLVGDVNPDTAAELARAHYADWQPGYLAPPVPAEPDQSAERRIDVRYEGRCLPVLWVAYKLGRLDPHARDRVAANLLAELAFGPTSELYRSLVLEQRRVEFLQADANWNRDPGLLDVYTRIKDPRDIERVLEALDATVRAYQDQAVSEQRLGDLKSRLRYDFLLSLDTPNAVARRLARPLALCGELATLEALYAAYAASDADAIRRAALRYLRPEHRTIALLEGST